MQILYYGRFQAHLKTQLHIVKNSADAGISNNIWQLYKTLQD